MILPLLLLLSQPIPPMLQLLFALMILMKTEAGVMDHPDSRMADHWHDPRGRHDAAAVARVEE